MQLDGISRIPGLRRLSFKAIGSRGVLLSCAWACSMVLFATALGFRWQEVTRKASGTTSVSVAVAFGGTPPSASCDQMPSRGARHTIYLLPVPCHVLLALVLPRLPLLPPPYRFTLANASAGADVTHISAVPVMVAGRVSGVLTIAVEAAKQEAAEAVVWQSYMQVCARALQM
eukprot:360870-Chlamydomonas_euryale.AAC.7